MSKTTYCPNIDIFNIEKYTFTAEQLIRPLCFINRYGGDTIRPLSVAEHSFKLSKAKEVEEAGLVRAALLHDKSEAVMGCDLKRPVKERCPEFQDIEERIQRHIFRLWNEPWENMERLYEFDLRICEDESTQLRWDHPGYGYKPLGVQFSKSEASWQVWYDLMIERCARYGIR